MTDLGEINKAYNGSTDQVLPIFTDLDTTSEKGYTIPDKYKKMIKLGGTTLIHMLVGAYFGYAIYYYLESGEYYNRFFARSLWFGFHTRQDQLNCSYLHDHKGHKQNPR